MTTQGRVKILFVCMGNICRSPMAEGYLRHRVSGIQALDVLIDSAGTHSYHAGSEPDKRAQKVAQQRGIDISRQSARPVITADFELFDYILAMDSDNLEHLKDMADEQYHGKVRLFLDFSEANAGRNVPDPYYGGPLGFERVLDLIEEATDGLLAEIEQAVAAVK